MNEPLHIVVGVVGFSIFIIEMIFFNHVFFKVACATAGEAQRWMEAFEQAKNQVCMRK
jgi:hypothetical protein